MVNIPMNMEYYDRTKEAGRKAVDDRNNEIQLPTSDTPAADVDSFCRDMEEQQETNNILKQVRKKKRSTAPAPVQKKRNRKCSKNMKYCQEQRDLFKKLFLEHGKKWTSAEYALAVGVSKDAISNWRRMVNHNQSLQYCTNRNAHRYILTDEEVKTLSDIIENGGRELTQAQLSNELKKKYPDRPKPSTSTVCRALHSKRMTVQVGRNYSWIVASRRGPNANSPANKERRVAVTDQLSECLSKGKIWVSIDETHWILQSRRKKVYSKKAFIVSLPWRTELSSIVDIDNRGRIANVEIVKGTVDAATFTAFYKTFAEHYKNDDVVFFLDNAPIHNKEELTGGRHYENHVVLFNAPYSEELNRNEMLFIE